MPFFGVPIRNGLPIGLGSVAGFGVQQFDPSQLFEGGTVAGAWYDPSDLSTMFDTSAGTTPVAMPGLGAAVPVGLMLDKSQGLVLGSEVVVSPLAGTLGASYSIVGDTIVRNGSTGTAVLNPVGGVIPSTSKTYLVTFTASGVTGDSVAVRVGGGTAYGPFAGNGTFTLRVPGGGTTGAITFLPFAGGAAAATYSNISVRELPGNHAISFNNTTARPELRARVNLLTHSEEFDNGAWVATNATKGTTTGTRPDGTTGTVHSLTLQGATTSYVYQTNSFAPGQTATFAIYVRLPSGSTATDVRLTTNNNLLWNTGISQKFALTSSWQRLLLSGTVTTTGTLVNVIVGNTDAAGNRDASIPAGVIEIWGADLRPANIGANVPAYQRIADANTYDTSGFPLYLRFDGIDDSMYTPANLNLSGTDKVAVFAGVRKLSDVTRGMVAELSNTFTNPGVFQLNAPIVSSTASYGFGSGGSLGSVSSANYTNAAVAAPVTNVVSGIAEIATDTNLLRVNSAQVASDSTDQGTGNFGTYPLFIGSRNNASFRLNGHLHSLIIAGSAVSAGNISATEQWVAGKTGIQI